MTSQISQDKNSISLFKLMREDFRHRRWMLVLSIVMEMLLGPIVVLFSVTAEKMAPRYYYDDERLALMNALWRAVNRGYSLNFAFFGAIIAVVGAVIVSVVGFNHLYSKRKMDLYGSIPVSRTLQFVATYINGVLIYLLPLLVNAVLSYVIGVVTLGKNGVATVLLKDVLTYLWKLILIFFSIYNLCLIAVMLSGNAFAAIVNAAIMGVLAIGFYFIIITRIQISFDTFYQADDSIYLLYAWLSPLAFPFIINISEVMSSDNFGIYIALSTILMVVMFFVAAALHKFRKAELAEGGVTNKFYIYTMRILASICGAMFMPEFFDIFFGDVHIAWQIFVITVGGVAIFGIANMIIYKSGRAFFKDVFVMIGATVVAIALFLSISITANAYDSYVPRKDNIKSVEVSFDSFHDEGLFYEFGDGKAIYKNSERMTPSKLYAKTEITDKDYAIALLKMGAENVYEDYSKHYTATVNEATDEYYMEKGAEYPDEEVYDEDEWGFESAMYVKVNLTNGLSYSRRYVVYTDDLDTVRPIVESKEYINKMFPLGVRDDLKPLAISYEGEYTESGYICSYITNPAEVNEFMEAYRNDFANVGDIFKVSQRSKDGYYVHFEFMNGDTTYGNRIYIYTYIPDSFETTINVLKKYSEIRSRY